MTEEYILEGLECANCAAKIERAINELDDIESAHINFMTQKLSLNLKSEDSKETIKDVQSIITSIEAHVKMTQTQSEGPNLKVRFFKIVASAVLLITAILLPENISSLKLVIFLASYLIVAYDVLYKAFNNIRNGQIFDENFLMGIATIGAFLIGEYPEGVAVMVFYQIGELFQTYAVGESRKSITSLMDIRPDSAHVLKNGTITTVNPEAVQVGDVIVIKPGEKVPLDAIITKGHSTLDTSALTGESLPRNVEINENILSGCINLTGVLEAQVTKGFAQSTVSQILDLVENASSKKSKSEQFITKFARYYTPVVVIIAALLAILPPLLIQGATFNEWIYRSLSFLVVSCPCALVISIPLSFFGGIGGASKQGILIKGSNYLEALAKTDVVVFDKTGTLTEGSFEVSSINPVSITQDELLEVTAKAEFYSNHPISLALKKAYGKEINETQLSDTKELAGYGIETVIDGKSVAVGNNKLMDKLNISDYDNDHLGTIVHTAIDGIYAGYIIIADKIKDDAKLAITNLKSMGIKETIMLTGDQINIANHIGSELDLDAIHAELLPTDKVDEFEFILASNHNGGNTIFVGDGINDAPVLARADVGIAMGGLGSDAAIEAADVVIMSDQPSKIATGIKISQRTLSIVYQNIVFAIGIKVLVLILSALGKSTMWHAIFADVGVTILAVLNALRALRYKD